MENNNKIGPKVIAFDLASRGFGYAVLEDETTLVDWGYQSVLFGCKKPTVKKCLDLIDHYLPDCVVLQGVADLKNRKAKHLSLVNQMIQKGCGELDVYVRYITQEEVHKTFQRDQVKNKHDIARAVAKWFPELEAYRPPQRKFYESEPNSLNIFDATAMALSFYDRYGR